MPDITELFRRISRSLAADFELVRLVPHHGESGRATEEILKRLLTNHLAARFQVTSGFVIGRDGSISRQADLLVIDALNCPRLLGVGGTGIYPVDGVVALIEVTQSLSAEKRQADLDKIKEFRGLASRFGEFFVPDFRDHAPLAFMFAERSLVGLDPVGEWLVGRLRATPAEERGRLPNGIVILDQGFICYVAKDGNLHADPCNAVGVAIIKNPEIALLVFLLFLMGRARVLIEHRIRARTTQILGIRTSGRPPLERNLALTLLDAAGGEPYFGELTDYFSVGDREILDQLVADVQILSES